MILVTGATGLNQTTGHPAVREVTGQEPRTFEPWASAHAAAVTS